MCIFSSVFCALQPSDQTYTFIKRLQGSNLDNVITAAVTITSLAVDIYGKSFSKGALFGS